MTAASLTSRLPASGDELSITVTGEPRTIYDWSEDRCEDEFIPDSPARAFRRADGQIALIATHRKNWMMVGDTFQSLKPVCHTIFDSSRIKNTEGLFWIQATYTRDGTHVVALVSNDQRNLVIEQGCDASEADDACWLNKIANARSTNMGESFALEQGPNRYVAQVANSYPDNASHRYGMFTTSNIFEHNKKFYFLSWGQGEGKMDPGNCLFRSDDPLDVEGWRGWDGEHFPIDMRLGKGVCRPITGLPAPVRSVSYLAFKGIWIATYPARLALNSEKTGVPAFYYSTSRDLIKWTPPERITRAPLKPRELNDDEVWAFPSIIDTSSGSHNFDTIDDPTTAILTYTKHHLRNGVGTMRRDLVYLPLRIQ